MFFLKTYFLNGIEFLGQNVKTFVYTGVAPLTNFIKNLEILQK